MRSLMLSDVSVIFLFGSIMLLLFFEYDCRQQQAPTFLRNNQNSFIIEGHFAVLP